MPLKSPEQAVRDALVSDPSVASLVGDRVYPVIAPASASLPLITWRRSAIQRVQTLSGPGGFPTVILAVDIYAVTYEAVRELADRCRRCLDGYGTADTQSVVVNNVSLENESDGFVQLAGGDVPPVYSVSQTYSVLWSE